ncbi:MAG: SDR family oxidoreductase [Bryobacteraceae bacterium]
MAKILVIGGTGTVGSATVRELLRRGAEVSVMTRSAEKARALPAGVTGVVGSMQQPESLPAVFLGIEKLFLITPLDRDEIQQGIDAVDAAAAAGVNYVVYLSVHQADTALEIPHFVSKLPVEGAIKASGVPYTILRPNNFFQNDLGMKDAILAGFYPQPRGPIGMHCVDVRDIAEAAAGALTGNGHANQTYAVVGCEVFNAENTAALYSSQLGRPVHSATDVAAWAAQARAFVPAWMVRDLVIMYDHFQRYGLLATPGEIETITRVLGHPPRRYEEFVRETLAGWEHATAAATA